MFLYIWTVLKHTNEGDKKTREEFIFLSAVKVKGSHFYMLFSNCIIFSLFHLIYIEIKYQSPKANTIIEYYNKMCNFFLDLIKNPHHVELNWKV